MTSEQPSSTSSSCSSSRCSGRTQSLLDGWIHSSATSSRRSVLMLILLSFAERLPKLTSLWTLAGRSTSAFSTRVKSLLGMSSKPFSALTSSMRTPGTCSLLPGHCGLPGLCISMEEGLWLALDLSQMVVCLCCLMERVTLCTGVRKWALCVSWLMPRHV